MKLSTTISCEAPLRLLLRTMAVTVGGMCLAYAQITNTVPGSVITSHFGNSWVMDAAGAPKWANYAVSDIWVAADGTTYNGSVWDEAAQEIGIYKGGDKIGKLNSTHEGVDGEAITGNGTHIFASNNNFFKRWNRSTKNIEGLAVDTAGQVWGLGADANRLFVGTGAVGGKISVYNTSTLAVTSEWAFARPGRMAVDSVGDLWVLQRSDATNAARAVKFSPAGAELATITFAAGVNPTDIATDGTTRVLVADGGPDLTIKIYNTASLTGTPTTVSDSLGTVGGVFAVSPGFVAGQAGANRFDCLTGVGIDSSGNYYTATYNGGSVIESYNSSKARLWQVFGLEFEDCADVDATNFNAIYTKDGKYTVDWTKGVGQEATYWGTTLNPYKYPNDPRLWINVNGNNNAGSRIITSGGHKLMYVWDQQSLYLQVYRFDGEIAVPAALFCRTGSKAEPQVNNPVSNDPWDMWIWQDTDKDGQFDSTEFTTYRADNPYMFAWNVDRDGNVWKGLRGNGIRKLTLTVNANGIPTYAPVATVLNPVPFDSTVSGDIRRVHYDSASDIMYITGFNSTNIQGGVSGNDDRGAGRLMSRYPNWSTGNRTASHTVQLPYNFDATNIWSNHYTPEAFDVVGDYVFVAYFDPGAARIGVYSTSSLTFVGEIAAGRVSGKIYGTDVDTPNAVSAFLRSNGEYIILQSNYGYANGLIFRWSPTSTTPPPTSGPSASGENAPTEGVAQAFDGNIATKWLTFETTGWIQHSYPSPTKATLTSYAITSANDMATRDPRNWQFLGSDDGIAWTVLDTRSGEIFSARYQRKVYTFTNTTAYSHYRLNITANNGATSLQLAELELNPTVPTSPDVTSGISARLAFNETSGTTAADTSGNNKNGTLQSGASFTAGKFANGLGLNGSNGYVAMPTVFNPGTQANFTVTAWVRLTASNGGVQVIMQQQDGSGTGRSWLFRNSAGQLATNLGNKETKSATVINTGIWYHVALVKTGTSLQLYANGSASGTAGSRTSESCVGAMRIGSHKSFTTQYWNGSVDEVRYYNRALSASEIKTVASWTGL